MWKILLRIESKHAEVYASSLTPEEEVILNDQVAEIILEEPRAKDLRAMWNTRVRGLIAVDSLINMIDNLGSGEDSSTSSE